MRRKEKESAFKKGKTLKAGLSHTNLGAVGGAWEGKKGESHGCKLFGGSWGEKWG